MANWGVTNITIICRSDEEAEQLYDRVKEWTSYDRAENGFGPRWLGNVILGAGIGDVYDFECRGYIVDARRHGRSVDIQEETAHRPMVKLWCAVVEKYCPSAYIEYIADNAENGIHITNNVSQVGLYDIDIYEDEILSRVENLELCDLSRNRATEVLQYALRTSREDFAELVYEFEQLDFGKVYEWEFVPVEEADAY